MTTQSDSEIWIGLVELTGPAGNEVLEGGHGAFTHCVAAVHDEDEFRRSANAHAKEIGLSTADVRWCEPLAARLNVYEVDQLILDRAAEAERTGRVYFSALHIWESDE